MVKIPGRKWIHTSQAGAVSSHGQRPLSSVLAWPSPTRPPHSCPPDEVKFNADTLCRVQEGCKRPEVLPWMWYGSSWNYRAESRSNVSATQSAHRHRRSGSFNASWAAKVERQSLQSHPASGINFWCGSSFRWVARSKLFPHGLSPLCYTQVQDCRCSRMRGWCHGCWELLPLWMVCWCALSFVT